MFMDPLEQPQQRGGPIITHGDIKGIFANIPDILAVHQRLVVRREDGGVLGRCVRSPKTSSEEGRRGMFRDDVCVDWRLHVHSGEEGRVCLGMICVF